MLRSFGIPLQVNSLHMNPVGKKKYIEIP